jgi:hypothetical protein
VSAAVVAVALLGAVLLWPSISIGFSINGLNADDPTTVREHEKALLESDSDQVDSRLEAATNDDDRAFRVRETTARILYRRQRLPILERILRSGTPAGRRAAVSALADTEHFQRDYLSDEGLELRGVVLDWIRDEEDRSRSRAVALAQRVGFDLKEAVPDVRKLLVRRTDGSLPPSEQQQLLIVSAAFVVRMADCESVPALERLAASDPDDIVRLRVGESLYGAVGTPKAPCASALPPERLRDAVAAALSDPSKNVRLGAMTRLELHQPAWGKELAGRLHEVLEGEGDPVERRQALKALSALGDERLRATLPRWFHDPGPHIRASAVEAAQAYMAAAAAPAPSTGPSRPPTPVPTGLEPCLVGLARFEQENLVAYQSALEGLRAIARRWVGLPDDLLRTAADRGDAWRGFLAELFAKGESRAVVRDTWMDEWARWCDEFLGLSPEDAAKAAEVRAAFWRAAKTGDVAGARAALEARPREGGLGLPGVFSYEEGWLASRT